MTNAEQRVKTITRQVKLVVGVICFFAFVAVAFLVALLLPYNPMTIHSYTPTPSEVCPDDLIAVEVDYEIADEMDVEEVEVRSYWSAVDAEGVTEGQKALEVEGQWEGASLASGRNTITSSLLRSAPRLPGEWLVTADIRVRGSAFLVPHIQEIRVTADEITTVLPPDDERC